MLLRRYTITGALACGLLQLFTLTANGQQLPVAALQNQFETYQKQALQEKLYVHTDRNTYLAGEPVWFKVYAVDGSFHKPLQLSKVAYVELLDAAQRPVLQAKVAMQDAAGNGTFTLPESLATGQYKLRAYTNWMKNFGTAFFFEKEVTLINTLQAPVPAEAGANAVAYDAQFFPEGGNLVQGLESRIAFRVTNQYGQGIQFKGAVLDDSNDTIATFVPQKFGMGSLLFKPVAGATYRVAIKPANAKAFSRSLPAVQQQGYTMRVTEGDANQLLVSVQTQADASGPQAVYLFAHTRQVAKVALAADISNGKAEVKIDRGVLGDGISHLTLFNQNKLPVCERLVYKRPAQILQIQARPELQHYTSRQQVKLDIATSIEQLGFVPANMSLAVYAADALQTPDQENILSQLLLTSDLAGTVETPMYYLGSGKEVELATDNLMLTHGWRRFKWENVLQQQKPDFSFTPEFEGMQVIGKVTDKATGEPAKGIIAYLSVPGKEMKFAMGKSDDKGLVKFLVKDVYYRNEIVLQAAPNAGKAYDVVLLSSFVEGGTPAVNSKHSTLPHDLHNTLLANSIHAQVQQHFAPANQTNKSLVGGNYIPFYGKANKTYLLSDYTKFPKVEDIVREYVSEVIVTRQKGMFVMDKYNQVPFAEAPLVMVDGVPVHDMAKLLATNPASFRQLDVIDEKYIYGSTVFNGVVHLRTFKGDIGGYELDPNAFFFDFDGTQVQKEFYAPVYDSQSKLTSRLPDFRSLLYWQPMLQTDEQGKQTVSFYTSDKKARYIGVLQGITKDGVAGYHTFSFEVADNL